MFSMALYTVVSRALADMLRCAREHLVGALTQFLKNSEKVASVSERISTSLLFESESVNCRGIG